MPNLSRFPPRKKTSASRVRSGAVGRYNLTSDPDPAGRSCGRDGHLTVLTSFRLPLDSTFGTILLKNEYSQRSRVENGNQNGRRKSSRRLIVPHFEALENRVTLSANVTITASQDNTLYKAGALDDPLGQYITVGQNGTTRGKANSDRGLVEFDLSGIPAGSTIISATLSMYVHYAESTTPQPVALYAMTEAWSHGSGDSATPDGFEGGGFAAMDGDSTWQDEIYNTDAGQAVPWSMPPIPITGSDPHLPFASMPSATAMVSGTAGTFCWTGLTSDVQNWLNNPSSNYGWILIGDESLSPAPDGTGNTLHFNSMFNDTTDSAVPPTTESPVPQLTITYEPPVAFGTGPSLPSWTVNRSYSQQIAADEGTGPYSFSLVSGTLPSGLKLTSSGAITGTPTTTGTSEFTLEVTDSTTPTPETQKQQFTLTINPVPTLGGLSQSDWTLGRALTATIPINGGSGPFMLNSPISGLPAGLTANVSSSTIDISGTPSALGNFPFTIAGTDSSGAPFSAGFDIDVQNPSAGLFMVNTTADTDSAAQDSPYDSNHNISLRSALEAAGEDANATIPVTDTIVVPAGDYVLQNGLYVAGDVHIMNAQGVSPNQIQITLSSQDAGGWILSIPPNVSATVQGVDITGSELGPDVNGIDNEGTLSLTDSELDHYDNTAIANYGTMSLSNCLLADNSSPFTGAGILNYGTMLVVDSTFSANQSSMDAGAIYNDVLGSLTVLNSTFVNNSAGTIGGAIENFGGLAMSASTVVFNSSGTGGAIESEDGEANLTGDIVVGNVAGPSSAETPDDVGGIPLQVRSSYNLVGADSTNSLKTGTRGNQVGVTVAQTGLAPLNDYGGPTPTLALVPGSYALGAFGNGGAVSTLADAVTSKAATSITIINDGVLAASSLPNLAAGSYFTIQIGEEQMAVTGLQLNVDGTATLSVTRGINGIFGTYSAGAGVSLPGDQRGFARAPGQAVDVGAFQAYPTSQLYSPFTVTAAGDGELSALPGQLSFRGAVDLADLQTPFAPVSISFDPTLFGTTQTIGLVSPLSIGGSGLFDTFTISGPGANLEISNGAGEGAVPGELEVAAGARVNVSGNITISAPMDVAAAAVTIGAQGVVAIAGMANFEGSLTVQGNLDVPASGSLSINSGGVLNVDAGAPAVTVEGTLDASGEINVLAGYTDSNGNSVPAGILDVSGYLELGSDSTLTDAGTLTLGSYSDSDSTLTDDGTLMIAESSFGPNNTSLPGGSFDIFGTVNVGFSGLLNDLGTMIVEFSLPNAPGQSLNVSGASLDDYGVVSIGGAIGGSLEVDGTLNVEMPIQINVGPPAGVIDLPGGTLNDNGPITVDSGGLLDDGNMATVYPVGSLDVDGTLALLQNPAVSQSGTPLFAPGTLDDFGTIEFNGDSPAGAAPGVIDDAGQLTVESGVTLMDTGTIAVMDGGAVSDGGPFVVTVGETTGELTVDATSSFTDDDTLSVIQGASADISGKLTVDAVLVLASGGSMDVSGTVDITNEGEMDVNASSMGAGTFSLEGTGMFEEEAGEYAEVNVQGNFLMPDGGKATISASFTVESGGFVSDGGNFAVTGQLGNLTVGGEPAAPAGEFKVEGQASSLTLEDDAGATIDGSLEIDTGSRLEIQSGATMSDMQNVEINGSMDVAAATTKPVSAEGTVLIDAGSTFSVSPRATATVEGSLTNIQGLLEVNGSLTEPLLTIGQGGELLGIGTLHGSVTVSSGGILSPGFDIGDLTTGNLTLDAGADFNSGLLSPAPGEYGEESVMGTVSLGGATLNLGSFPAFKPQSGDQYILINNESTGAVSGNFVAGTGVDAFAPGATLNEGAILSTNFLGSDMIARLTYLAGSNANSVAITLSPLVPASDVVKSLGTSQTSDSFPVSVTFSEPAGGVGGAAGGVSSVDLYYSVNNGAFMLYQTNTFTPTASGTTTFMFNGQDRNLYAFHSVAHDSAGNTEPTAANEIEASTSVPDLNPPVTHILSSSPSYSWNPFPSGNFSTLAPSSYSNGVFTINWAGADPDANTGIPAGSISIVNIYVVVDGGTPVLIAQPGAGTPSLIGVYSGSITYNALGDGLAHTYSFYSVGVDDQHKVQYTPAAGPASPDVTFSNITYTAPLAVQSFVVEKNIAERSFIQYLDVDFNQSLSTSPPSAALESLSSGLTGGNAGAYVELMWYGENLSASSTPEGSVNLFGTGTTASVSLTGNDLSINFGPNGITSLLAGAPASPATKSFGDGWYALGIDATGNPSNGQVFWLPFFRLLGDTSGSTVVTGPYTAAGTDAYTVYHAEGESGPLLNADIDGSGAVNIKDFDYTVAAIGHSVGTTAPANFPQFQVLAAARRWTSRPSARSRLTAHRQSR